MLNLQYFLTGRDHGIPGYTTYQKMCNLEEIRKWSDLKFSSDCIKILQKVYAHFDDIDLFIGGLVRRSKEFFQQ